MSYYIHLVNCNKKERSGEIIVFNELSYILLFVICFACAGLLLASMPRDSNLVVTKSCHSFNLSSTQI